MIENLEFLPGSFSENEARLRLAVSESSDIVSMTGRLRGPYCETAKTLTSNSPLVPIPNPPPRSAGEGLGEGATRDSRPVVESVVVDPCYWTPQMPFQYKASVQVQTTAGEEVSSEFVFGMKRWCRDKTNLRLNLRRIVLRGTRVSSPSVDDLVQAHQLETALIVDSFNHIVGSEASRLGVALVVDLRNVVSDLPAELQRLDWLPAVLVALVSSKQLNADVDPLHMPKQCLLAQCLDGGSQPGEVVMPETTLLAVELAADERPPHWLATVAMPVLVVRRAEPPLDLSQARRGCDRLQAELAPEFNLAGYFV